MINSAYIAGFFDGEGCVSFRRVRTSVFPVVLITNTNLSILEAIQDRFGGDIQPLSKRKAGWKRAYYLRLSWSRAVNFLDEISPYLHIKALQAHTVFAWDAVRPGRGNLPKEEMESYRSVVDLLVRRMKWLNRRGAIDDSQDPIDEELGVTKNDG